MKTLLVTGGCGFIGSHFIKRFLKNHPDWNITNLDKLTYCGNPENTKGLESTGRYRFVKADICDVALVDAAMKGVDAVVHFAAETHVDRSLENPNDFLITNIVGTRTLIDAARKALVKRFILISTDEVYGSIAKGAANEESKLNPSSPYSAAKAGADLLALAYWETYHFPIIITRSSNNYGPNQYPEKVIPLFITHLLEGKSVPLYGNGENRRDWIYVEDNCAALELVFEKGMDGEIYNVGIGKDVSNIELTKTILHRMGFDEKKIRYVEDRLGHDFRYSLDTTKITKLGFVPEWTFEKGIEETIRWYREHPEWWQPLKKDKFTVK
jgi:dTDP-glucose 4,6-dehydratase